MLLHVNFFVALPLAVALGVALGALIEFVLLRRLRGADIDTTMLVMIGAWIAMQNAEQLPGRASPSRSTRRSRRAACARRRLGRLEPAVRVRGGRRADRAYVLPDQPHPARQGDARDLPGPRHRDADGHRRSSGSTRRPSRWARGLPRRRARCSAPCSSSSPAWATLPR